MIESILTAVFKPGITHYALCLMLVCAAFAARGSTRARQLALLLASWLFYVGWGVGFLVVLVSSSAMNYWLGEALKKRVTAGRLWSAVALNVVLLAFFKYGTGALAADPRFGFMSTLIRPIGVSFWTLQALSYLFDIYREEELDPTLLEFCLYMAFWPTVITGPICRLPSLLPQFRQPIRPSADDVSIGVKRVLQGLFMKMVLAEILASGWSAGAGTTRAFDGIRASWGGLDVWVLVIAFGFQLFFDFAGYSHIVIGGARLLGITLDENFDRPFRSPTPAAFWNRWHMSLSFWIRDFVFLQAASLRRGRTWVYLSLLFSMVVCGLWHEAAPTFIAWGTYHGLLLVAHRIGQQIKRSLGYQFPHALGLAASSVSTFLLVSVGWLFFRAHTLAQALKMAGALFAFGSYTRLAFPLSLYAITAAVVVAWGLVQLTEAWWERWQTELRRRVEEHAAAKSISGSTSVIDALPSATLELISFGRANMWWWLAPMVIVFGMFAGLAINDLKPAPPTTPFMYTLF